MYRDEFEKIWESQARYHKKIMTAELKGEIEEAIFYQRPLKSMKRAVGYCPFERYRRRAETAMPCFQEFRMLQTINNLKYTTPDGVEHILDDEARSILISEFMKKKELSFNTIRKKTGIPEGSYFNFENPNVDKLKCGNTTYIEMTKIFGDEWLSCDDIKRKSVVKDILASEKDDELISMGMGGWGLNEEKAVLLPSVKFESGYASLSEKAIERLLPYMRKGFSYAGACKEVYGDRVGKPLDRLPALDDSSLPNEFRYITNPIVRKTITELRRVVNAIIKEYGKPERIVVELARDLKKSKAQREEIYIANIKKNKERMDAARQIMNECGVTNPSRNDVEKWLLFLECDKKCPYTFKPISPSELFDGEKWQVEHIIPFSRSLDDSFNNKTLCLTSENATKGNKTPFEAYGGDKRWDEMVVNARRIWSGTNRKKLELFLSEKTDFLEGFSTRQLNDTRYAAKLAMGYLGLLYGGINDKNGKRIHASQGTVTAYIRNAWNLNSLLHDGPGKNREDHRHHAVDAIAIAYTEPGIVQKLSVAASKVKRKPDRPVFEKMEKPCPDFLNKCREVIEPIIVVHRVEKKYKGKMHEDTHYSRKITAPDGNEYVHIRKKLDGNVFSKGRAGAEKWVEKIVDKRIAKIIILHLEKHEWDPKKAFAENNLPFSETKDGRKIPIKKARIRVSDNPVNVGSGHRHVLTGSNHHVEIYETRSKKGETIWQGNVVSTYEVAKKVEEHRNTGSAVFQPDKKFGKFIISLAIGETFGILENGNEKLCRVDGVTVNKEESVYVKYRSIFNAGRAEYGVTQFSKTVNALREVFTSKYTLTPLGELRRAND